MLYLFVFWLGFDAGFAVRQPEIDAIHEDAYQQQVRADIAEAKLWVCTELHKEGMK